MSDKKQIEEIRLAINKYDDKILILLLERFILSRKIGKIKNKYNIPINSIKREEEILNRISKNIRSPLDTKAIRSIFREIFNFSKKMQNTENNIS
tara:strand:- start:112 stop:396 length:285 start_codon:yes stop_codon:yes gene_type:complete